MARTRKNEAQPEVQSQVLSESEHKLDAAYDQLSQALRSWREAPNDEARITRLAAAYDEKQRLLYLVVDEEIAAEAQAAAIHAS